MLKPLRSRGAAPFALVLCVTLFATQPMLGQTFNVIHTFNSPQGSGPIGTLAIDAAGNLYGATESGGAHGQGTVFKLRPAHGTWTLNVLHSFGQKNGDGSQPEGGPTVAPDGVVYGTTVAGGLGYGTVYSVSPAPNVAASALQPWDEAPIYSFTGGADGSQPSIGSLLLDSQGNLYGVTPEGGDLNAGGVLYELSRSGGTWNENVLYAFCSEQDCLDGGNPYAGPVSDAEGNLYGTLTHFNFDTCIAAYEYPPVGGYQVLLSNFGGCLPFGSLIFDQAGNLYGTTFSGGGTVFELTEFDGQWNSSLLYAFAGTENENTGPLGGLLFDASGNLWGTTNGDGAYGFGNVFKLTLSHGSWIYTDVYDFTGGNDGGNPTGSLIADGSGNMYGTAMTGGANGSGVVFEITP